MSLGIDPENVKISGRKMIVTVHSLGAIDAPPSNFVLRDAKGAVIATAMTAPLKAPTDLLPKSAQVALQLPTHAALEGGTVTIESSGGVPETTLMNNTVKLPAVSAAAPTALSQR